MSSQSKKSNVGTFPSSNSSGSSQVNTRSVFTLFIAGRHSLAILWLVVSFLSYFMALSSSLSSWDHVKAPSVVFHLMPNLSEVDLCLTSSTYPSNWGSLTPALSRILLQPSPQSDITILAAAMVTLAPMGPPALCW